MASVFNSCVIILMIINITNWIANNIEIIKRYFLSFLSIIILKSRIIFWNSSCFSASKGSRPIYFACHDVFPAGLVPIFRICVFYGFLCLIVSVFLGVLSYPAIYYRLQFFLFIKVFDVKCSGAHRLRWFWLHRLKLCTFSIRWNPRIWALIPKISRFNFLFKIILCIVIISRNGGVLFFL